MLLEFEVYEVGAGDDPAVELCEWLREGKLSGVSTRVQPGSGDKLDAGITMLAIVLGSKAVVEVARGIHTWLKTRSNNVRFKRTEPDGTKTEVVVSSLQSVDEIALAISTLVASDA